MIGAGLNTDVAPMNRLFKQEWSELNKAGRREREEKVTNITLITVMEQTSLLTLLHFKLILAILLNKVATVFDLAWFMVKLLSLKPLTAWAAF